MKCADCGKELERDEKGLSYKLIGRGSPRCYCLGCLGRQFRLTETRLRELIEQFRSAGCTLFR